MAGTSNSGRAAPWAVAAVLLAMALGLSIWLRESDGGVRQRVLSSTPAARTGAVERRSAPSSRVQPEGSAALRKGDRRSRDELRRSIYDSLRRSPPVTPARAASTARPPLPPAPRLDAAYVQERVRNDFIPLASACYEELLARAPAAAGKVVFEFTIVGDAAVGGIVESVELGPGTTLSEPEFAFCVRESLLSTSFAAPAQGGITTVTYPIDFSAGAAPDATAGSP